MKKLKRVGVFLAGVFLAAFLGTLVGCGEPVTQPESSGEEPQEQPPQGKDTLLVENMRTELGYSEDFKTGGAFSVTLKKADGTERTLNAGEYTVDSSAVQKGVPGTYDVKVTAEGLETSYSVKVLEKQKWEEDGVLKIFMIGNSHSVDTISHAYGIAKDLGVEAVLANLAIGGCTLEQHLQYFSEETRNYDYYLYTEEGVTATQYHFAKEELQSDNWDFISIQQTCTEQGLDVGFDSIDAFIDILNEWKNPETEIVYNMTWALEENAVNPAFNIFYGRDQMKQYNAIISHVKSGIEEQRQMRVIPNATTVQNARTSFLGNHITMDGIHLNRGTGQYMAGVTLISMLSGKSPEGLAWMPDEMNGNTKERVVAIESAMNALKAPYEITQSKYTK